jgi:hypothetical protein
MIAALALTTLPMMQRMPTVSRVVRDEDAAVVPFAGV